MRALRLRMLCAMLRGPGSSSAHPRRMERLYRSQAEGYDNFRERFLHGRSELLARLDLPAGSRVVELGGGTGRNLEFFGDRLRTFAAVTMVDICPSLLEVAKARRRRLCWTNVEVVEGDAATWRPTDDVPVDAVYFSYSLTMIPDWFEAIDNALSLLKTGGLLGVVDFYISREHPPPGRPRHGRANRVFWHAWFGHADVFLNPDHLPFLESRTETVHRSEHRGSVPYLPLLRPPYYLYVGRKRS